MFRATIPWVFFLFLGAAAAAGAQNQTAPKDDPKSAELPDGDGKKILDRACTTCHGLDEVVKFKGFYTKSDWRDIVDTMVKYGAELKEGELEVLLDYLGRHLAKEGG